MMNLCSKTKSRSMRRTRGFSLLETLIAATVLAFAVVAVSQAIVSGQMSTYAALHELRATSLAEAMLEEVLSKSYSDPDGSSSGEDDRSDWDNLTDFNGFAEDAGDVLDVAGAAYPSMFSEFARGVVVADSTMTIPGFDSAVTGKNVTVTVTDADGKQWSVTRFVPESSN